MGVYVVKVTSKNQITLPGRMMRELGRPSHFKAYVQEGNLVGLSTFDDQAKGADVPRSVLRRAYAMAADGAPAGAATEQALRRDEGT